QEGGRGGRRRRPRRGGTCGPGARGRDAPSACHDRTSVVLLKAGITMIEHVKGNLLEAKVEALVNTVNTVGVMGKGIALQFKRAFPENFRAYKRACDAGALVPGKM